MKENSWKKWLYWFSFGVAIIIVFNIFNNFDNLKQIIGNFFQILSPFLAGILIAYILYLSIYYFKNSLLFDFKYFF